MTKLIYTFLNLSKPTQTYLDLSKSIGTNQNLNSEHYQTNPKISEKEKQSLLHPQHHLAVKKKGTVNYALRHSCLQSAIYLLTDYRRPVRKSPSLHGQKSTPNPKFLGTAEAYFVCHISPNFQISLINAMPSLGIRSP